MAPALAALILFTFGYWIIAGIFVLLMLGMAFFFRDPSRKAPADGNVVVAPADGRVTRVRQVTPGETDSPTLVSIFLSPLDVHINRAPIAGVIRDVSYVPGKFLMATNERASVVNEQNALTIEGENITVVCKQIAGILARRVVCWKRKGDRLSLGERFGLIKFSSRTDLILPQQVDVLVEEGARVKGGTTIIGRIR
jgi:phosphatidylserine decarboxylase